MSKVYVMGGSQTDFERNWSREGKNVLAMLREVIADGCDNAHITYDDIVALNEKNRVACFVGSYLSELYNSQSHVGALLTEVNPAFYGVPAVRCEAAGASGAAALDAAVTKIAAGEADVAIVVGWALVNSVDAATGASYVSYASYMEKESIGVDAVMPHQFDQLVGEYLKRYDAPKDRVMKSLAHLAELGYEGGKRNPKAQTRKLYMCEEQANMRGCATNPMIGEYLAQSDANMVTTDGAAIVVLCSEEYKKAHCADAAMPYVKGRGVRVAPIVLNNKLEIAKKADCLLPWTKRAVDEAYAQAGMTADDIDVFELHDYFTMSEYLLLSCIGLAEPGKEYELIESGKIEFGGEKPVNPTGGFIGGGNPQAAGSVRMFLDIARQTVGAGGKGQVEGAKNGLMVSFGGVATSNYVFIVGM